MNFGSKISCNFVFHIKKLNNVITHLNKNMLYQKYIWEHKIFYPEHGSLPKLLIFILWNKGLGYKNWSDICDLRYTWVFIIWYMTVYMNLCFWYYNVTLSVNRAR